MKNTKYNIIGLVFLCTSCLYPMQQSTTSTACNQIAAPAQTSSSSLNDQTTNNSAPNQNQTPIPILACQSNDDIFNRIKIIIKNGSYKELNNLFDLLVENDIPYDINYVPQNETFNPLRYACFELVKNSKNAIKSNNYESIIQLLLNNGAHITSLITYNFCAIVAHLIKKGALVNIFDSCGCSELYAASNSQNMVQLLLSLHVPPFQEGSVCAQLVDAVTRNNIAGAASAIRSGISSRAIFTNKGENILALAARNGNAKIAEMLLLNAKFSTEFLVFLNDDISLEFILHHTNIYFKKAVRAKLLTIARANNNQKIIALLNDYDIEKNKDKQTDATMEIEAMNSKPQPLCFTQSENDFFDALAHHNYKQALVCLKTDPLIRLKAISPKFDFLSYSVQDSSPINKQDHASFIMYVLTHHFNDIYPLIQNMVKNDKVQLIQQLINFGLNVNAHQGFFPDKNGLMPRDERGNADIGKGPLQQSLLELAIKKIRGHEYSLEMLVTLLKAGADVPKVMQEKMDLLNEIQLAGLLGAIKQYTPSLYDKVNDTLNKIQHRFNAKDTWSWGILLYDLLTDAQHPVDFSMLPEVTKLPKVTKPIKMSAPLDFSKLPNPVNNPIKKQPKLSSTTSTQSTSTSASQPRRKHHMDDNECIESGESTKRQRFENLTTKATIQSENHHVTSIQRSQLSQIKLSHLNHVIVFDPNRWLNAIKLRSAAPLHAIRHHKH